MTSTSGSCPIITRIDLAGSTSFSLLQTLQTRCRNDLISGLQSLSILRFFTTERDQEHLKVLTAFIKYDIAHTASEAPRNITLLDGYKSSRLQTGTPWLCSQLTAKLCRNKVRVPKNLHNAKETSSFIIWEWAKLTYFLEESNKIQALNSSK